ncbi:ATP-binding protein [Planctomycetota bacterium]
MAKKKPVSKKGMFQAELVQARILASLARDTAYVTDIRELFRRIQLAVRDVVNYDVYMCVILQGKDEGYLFTDTASAVSRSCMEEVRADLLRVTNYLTRGKIKPEDLRIESGETEILSVDEKRKAIRSSCNIPIVIELQPIGIINVSSFAEDAFSKGEVEMLYSIAEQTSSLVRGLRKVISAETKSIESIIESLGDGVVVVGADGRTRFMNPASKAMLATKRNDTASLDRLKGYILKDLAEAKKGPKIREVKVRDRILDVVTTPLGFEEEPDGAVAVLRDVTKAREVERMKNELISNVSHELRTPLTTVKEFVAILLDGLAGELKEEQKEYLHIVRSNIDRLARIVSDLLDISRLESGSIQLSLEPVSVVRTVRQAAATLRPSMEEAGISFTIDLPTDLPAAYGDSDRILQIFLNLITNAIKYTPSGGEITISGRELPRKLELSVSDTGEGIPEDRLKEVFDRFLQLGRVPGPGARGIGLGLAIVKELVKMHRGKVWVESKLGEGSRFSFTVPKLKKSFSLKDYVADQKVLYERRHRGFSIVFIEIESDDGTRGKDVVMEMSSGLETVLRSPRDTVFVRDGGIVSVVALAESKRQGGLVFVKRLDEVLVNRKVTYKTEVLAYPADKERIDGLACEWAGSKKG